LEEQEKFEIDPKTLKELGLPEEIIEKIKDSATSSINLAEGGKGGHSISLTYIDNYSSLLLIYTFLLHSLKNQKENTILNEALLSTLRTSLKEQQEYRTAFLNAVKTLSKK
jgi:hypothetical protein